MKKQKNISLLTVVLIVIAVVIVLRMAYLGGRWLEERNYKPETRGDLNERIVTINVDGIEYKPKRNITALLLMGIDKDSNEVAQGFRNGGQADFLELLVLDHSSKKVTCLPIDRDTITPITILSVLGKKSGERNAQISLSHGFGDGKEQSCELTAEAVSNLLLGIEINDYIAMNLDGIPKLNDTAGGVTVTLEDDFSALDPAMTFGTTLTLRNVQAEYYVRSRMNIGIGTNEARMARQKTYLSGLTEKLREKMERESFVATLYDELLPYLQTNMSRGLLINRVWSIRNYSMETIELTGTHSVGSDGFMEFHADENKIKDIVLALFYEKLK